MGVSLLWQPATVPLWMYLYCVTLLLPDPKSSMKWRSKLKIDSKEARDTGDPWPHLEIERSKVKVTRQLNAVTENQPYLRTGKAYTNFKLGIHGWNTMTRITDMRNDLHAESSVHVTTCRGRGHCDAWVCEGRERSISSCSQSLADKCRRRLSTTPKNIGDIILSVSMNSRLTTDRRA